MTTLARRNSSIHKVKEYQLNKLNLEEEYDVIQIIQEGWRGKLLLVEHKRTNNEVVLKAIHKEATSRLEFFREFHYNYYLSPHPSILNAYDVAFQCGDYYVFAQEYAPFADLTSNMHDIGLGEAIAKKVAVQLASALDFMHSKNLVHRDINMDHILVFKTDFSEVKLCDFGSTRKTGTLLKKKVIWLPYAPPEIVEAVQNEGFHVDPSQDVWQMGILIFVLLTGSLPWMKADLTDPHYVEYTNWRKRKTRRTPKRFNNFTTRLLRMFKRLLEPKPEKRCSVKEVYKYVDNKWLLKVVKKQDWDIEGQSVCYSTYSLHSCKVEKDRVLYPLKINGLETTVDRVAKKKRINEWLETSLSTRHIFDDDDSDNLILKPAASIRTKPRHKSTERLYYGTQSSSMEKENKGSSNSFSAETVRQGSDEETESSANILHPTLSDVAAPAAEGAAGNRGRTANRDEVGARRARSLAWRKISVDRSRGSSHDNTLSDALPSQTALTSHVIPKSVTRVQS